MLEAESYFYAIRLRTNRVLQGKIAHLLKRPVGRPPNHVRRTCGDFQYQAASWDKPRRVIAKVEWHPGELFPRVGFVVTNMPMEADWIIQFYNQRGTAEQHIKEGKQAINWTRLSCKGMAQNEVRLQLHALAYNLGVFLQGTRSRPGKRPSAARVRPEHNQMPTNSSAKIFSNGKKLSSSIIAAPS